MEKHSLILFDGVCNLCNGLVRFLLKRDPQIHFRFGSLQSSAVQQLLKNYVTNPLTIDSIVVIENEKVYTKSDAVLHIIWRLKFPWTLLLIFRLFPKKFLDNVYDLIARKRYAWFGKRDECMIPDEPYADRFID